MRVVILRGPSGAGKSTLAEKMVTEEGATVVSADHFFEIAGGYKFDSAKLGEAHRACMTAFLDATEDKHGRDYELTEHARALVVVDNTNVRLWEFAGYVQIARARGYEVEVIRLSCDHVTAARRGLHGVPANKVADMANHMERLPRNWGIKERVVFTDDEESKP